MALLICMVVGTAVFILGIHQFQIRPLIPHLDSLRQGKNTYLVVGIFAGILFPETESQYRAFDTVRYGFLNIGLIWFGLLLGLECSLRQLRKAQWYMVGGQIASAGFIVSFAILSILASGSILFLHLGLVSNLSLATLLCTCFVLSTRFPEPALRWRGRPTPPTPDPTPNLPTHNMIALCLLTFGFPFFASNLTTTVGSFSFVGGFGLMTLIAGLGFLAGSCLDFALRTHRDPANGMATTCCILIFFAGLGQTLALPVLSVGFISGAWLINTTVAKRALLEALSRVDSVVTPLFYLFVGTLIGGYGGGVFALWPPLLPLVAMILIVRTMGRTLGYSVSQYFWRVPEKWRDTLELSARPLGPLSVALAVQALFLLDLDHNTLIAGLITSTILSQITLFPPHDTTPIHRIASIPKD
ncbi:MAG: hypothetical protein HOE48_22175 [Candidatus Latescibacteria bacterium]|nr:hypothetical protein [Candidatus Latescibacterota bacterium]